KPEGDDLESPMPTPKGISDTEKIVSTNTPKPSPTAKSTAVASTEKPEPVATQNATSTSSPTPTAKETEKQETATATSTMTPTATPTVVPATPTPVPDDLAELDANWDYKINVKEKNVTLNDYKGESTNVYVKKSYKIEGQDLKAVLAETVRKYGAYIPEHAEGPFAGHNGYSNAKIETVEFEDGFDFGESIDNLFWGNMFLTKVVGLKGNIKSMESTFRNCDLFNQNIEIPSTVTNMNNCFKECSSLNQEIKIPASVISMSGCFMACEELEVAPKISALSECVYFSSVFANCKKFNPSSFSIPPLAETIAHAFENCESLNIKIAIPDSVVDGTSAFSGCKSLETMPTNTCSTGLKKYSYMFYNCSGIKNAYFHLRNFEEMISTFEGCSGFIKDEWGNYDFIIMGGYPADGFDVSKYKNIFKNCCEGEIKVNPGNTAFWNTLNSNENVKMYIYSNIYGCRQCDKK
ncbi:MAG: leucine-rich repeat protein, partial [Lachnospiraceae bacterium]|nr:leucine-rich repeat protein [Lachnospiraceae bacterium]